MKAMPFPNANQNNPHTTLKEISNSGRLGIIGYHRDLLPHDESILTHVSNLTKNLEIACIPENADIKGENPGH
jgi:hypothetical protein